MTLIGFELLLVGDIGNFVLIVSSVDAYTPREFARAHEFRIELHFHTAVAHAAQVGIIAGEAIRTREAVGREHVVCAAVEHFHLTAQATFEEREFNTHVEVTALFPRNVLITQTARRKCQTTIAIFESIDVSVAIATDAVITLFAIRCLQFEFVYPRYIEETFLRDEPSTREAPEVAPAMVGMEARRSIATERSRSEIAIEEVIVGTCKPPFSVVHART